MALHACMKNTFLFCLPSMVSVAHSLLGDSMLEPALHTSYSLWVVGSSFSFLAADQAIGATDLGAESTGRNCWLHRLKTVSLNRE